jgi:hypothetical protein
MHNWINITTQFGEKLINLDAFESIGQSDQTKEFGYKMLTNISREYFINEESYLKIKHKLGL